MARSIRDNTKKIETRGRKKTTGPGELIGVRLHKPQIDALDRWAAQQPHVLSRPEAIRRLVEQALAGKGRARVPSKDTAHKASEMAHRELEPLGDKSVHPDERGRRKRLLIRGPKEFRELRGDQSKSKT